eukprot:TRINITY_DN1582_c0_g1_i3.p1 TRINITY_DN1582_c0_g1~~TRINITY_DN1582_c0_g1_i3.p1  ORF type:complete len:222 (+),score=10.72 TRINITY_DN1582_c0_g1_i3:352-1017(+)
MHELSHNLAFKTAWMNRVLSIFVNFPLGVPAAITFKKYHLEHHYYQGVDEIDVDIPSKAEAYLITNTLSKLLFVLTQIAFYAIRPLAVKPKNPNGWEALNWAAVISFDYAIYTYIGPQALGYLLLCSVLGISPSIPLHAPSTLSPFFLFFFSVSFFLFSFLESSNSHPALLCPSLFRSRHPPCGWSFHCRTLCVYQGIRNILILWTLELVDLPCWIPQRTS